MNKLTYQLLRPSIQTGDCLLERSNDPTAKLIQCWSYYNHAALILRLDRYEEFTDKIFIVEATGKGLRLHFLSDYLEQNLNSKVFHYAVHMTEAKQARARDFALTEIAKDKQYDWLSLIQNVICLANMNMLKYLCSEFVAFDWVFAQLIEKPKKSPRPDGLPKLYPTGDLTQISLPLWPHE